MQREQERQGPHGPLYQEGEQESETLLQWPSNSSQQILPLAWISLRWVDRSNEQKCKARPARKKEVEKLADKWSAKNINFSGAMGVAVGCGLW